MKHWKIVAAAAWLAALQPSTSAAQLLEGRHELELRLGVWARTTEARTQVGPASVRSSVGGSGFMGGLAYTRWLTEEWALDVSLSAMEVDVESSAGVSGVTSETSVISSIMVGTRYSFPPSAAGSSVRPYVEAGGGVVIGTQTESAVGPSILTTSRTEAAAGGDLGIGIDFLIGHRFVLGVGGAYQLMTDFSEPIGGDRNYSGPTFALRFGYLFGRGPRSADG